MSDDDSWDEIHATTALEQEQQELSEAEARELYDNEEIERFLTLFAANVTEVQMPAHHNESSSNLNVSNTMQSDSIDSTQNTESLPSLSQQIASRWLIPLLPLASHQTAPFTLGRFRITTQRLYLSTVPSYGPFLRQLWELAVWNDKRKSTIHCTIYWFLWYHNLLLPALILRILYCLVRRRLLPYPTAAELRKRQQEIDRAAELGNEFTSRLSTSSSLDLKEMWRLFRVISTPQSKAKGKRKERKQDKEKSAPGKGKEKETPASNSREVLDDQGRFDVEDPLEFENPIETPRENNFKRSVLHTAQEIADFHERIHNVFIWRRPDATRKYGLFIFICFLLTLLLPAQYIAKLVYFVVGVLFWHVTPVIAALSPEDRDKLPPPFAEIPTDSDYAMELISQRIAAGLDVRPANRYKRSPADQDRGTSSPSPVPTPDIGIVPNAEKKVDWKKWGERAAVGKAWAVENRLLGNPQRSQDSILPRSLLVPTAATIGQEQSVESHTFPCHHTSAPGLITLTSTMFFFTPVMAVNPKVTFPLSYLKAVKKAGLLKGLNVKWIDKDANAAEYEEVFKWVGGRDELFARLVGTDVKRWMRS